ncbi:MAG: hypothetical protein KBB51_01410 [Candidatus Moranbacteria bacterium]|jgi:hypothetical protein|nr:hypothetical protein [Candidatus Moranbacteria bacterium]
MIFHFTILLWSFVFSFGLWFVAQGEVLLQWSWYLSVIGPLVFISVIAAERVTHRIVDAALPILLSVTAPVLLSLIDAPVERELFVVIAGGMYYLGLLALYRLRSAPTDQTAQALLSTAIMAAMFFFYSGIYGFYVNFNFPLWGLMALFFFGTGAVSYQALVSRERRNRWRSLFYSLVLGLIMGECAWAFGFWPFGYLTTGAIALILYAILWDVTFTAFYGELSLKRVIMRILFLLAFVMLILASTPWRILV